MRPLTLCIALMVACTPDPVDTSLGTDTETESETETETEEVFPGVGDPMPAFALLDINPSSPTFDQVVGTADRQGQAYSVLFLDARCTTCPEVAEELFVLYEENPAWQAGLPMYMINGVAGAEIPQLLEAMVVGNSFPYLQDEAEGSIWAALHALNHDWYIVDADGVIEDRVELYTWPADKVLFTDFMSDRFGD